MECLCSTLIQSAIIITYYRLTDLYFSSPLFINDFTLKSAEQVPYARAQKSDFITDSTRQQGQG